MEEKLHHPLVGIFLDGVSVVDHVHGALTIHRASSVETRLSFLCYHLHILMLEAQKQFILMALPKLQTTDVESVVKEFLSPVTTFSSLKELPPKYEDVEDFPPEYDEQTMITQEKQSNYVCEGSTTVQNVQ